MSGLPEIRRGPREARRSRDALAVLASVMLMHGRPGEAATLLQALSLMPWDAAWARRARCQALLLDGQPALAASEARRLLHEPMDDSARVVLLHLLSRAEWRLGHAAEARARFAEALGLAKQSVVARVGA